MNSDSPWDDDNDVFDSDDSCVLDSFDEYVPRGQTGDAWEQPKSSADDGCVETLLFTATNPPATVSVTALLDGRILEVNLHPQVESLTESQLAEEISIVARLARRQARAAQYAITLELMHKLGYDRVATSGYLERELNLPSPQTVLAEKARVFASHVAGHDE